MSAAPITIGYHSQQSLPGSRVYHNSVQLFCIMPKMTYARVVVRRASVRLISVSLHSTTVSYVYEGHK